MYRGNERQIKNERDQFPRCSGVGRTQGRDVYRVVGRGNVGEIKSINKEYVDNLCSGVLSMLCLYTPYNICEYRTHLTGQWIGKPRRNSMRRINPGQSLENPGWRFSDSPFQWSHEQQIWSDIAFINESVSGSWVHISVDLDAQNDVSRQEISL